MMTLAYLELKLSQDFHYMNNLVVIGCSEKQIIIMIKILANVFNLCKKFNLKLHLEKCLYFMDGITILGFKSTDKETLPDKKK